MQPQISLVICTYNRCRYLPGALETVRLQTASPALFELIIVDNASTDNTATIAHAFIAANPHLDCRYCYEAKKGLSAARNRGIAEASSEVINYVDDDALLAPGYLQAMISFFNQNSKAAGAGGRVIPKYASGQPPEWMSKYLDGFIGKVEYGQQQKPFDHTMKYPVGCNMAYRKLVLQQAGGFNEALQFRSDDKYIFQQVKKISPAIYYIPDAVLQHYIDAHRLEINNFKQLFLKTGNEEKKRVLMEQGFAGLLKKGAEFLIKTAAAALIFVVFFLQGNRAKGKYVWLSQWCTLKGFFRTSVFVR